MPPRRRAAQKAATPPPSPLEGCAIALSGKFDTTHAALEQVIQGLGGTVTKSITKNTTHLVCTDEDFAADTAKVVAAKAKDILLLKPSWLSQCVDKKDKVDEKDHLHSSAPTTGSTTNGSAANGAASGATNGADHTKKRPIAVANANGSDEPKTKKTKGAKGAASAGADTNAAVKTEPEPEEAEEEAKFSEGQFIKKQKNMEVLRDGYCYLVDYQVHIDADTGLIWDASLNQSNSSNNNNKFYRIQVLHNPKTNDFKAWTRWGRVGEVGTNAVLGNGKLDDAIKAFKKKFRDKSGLAWESRGDDPKPGKYAFVERNYDADSDDEEDAPSDKKTGGKDGGETEQATPDCTLVKPVKELMELIFNQQYFQATMTSLNYDAQKLPLGKLSKATIMRGFQQLKDLAALMDDSSLAQSRWNMAFGSAVEHLSNTYYSLIPHAFGRNRPPVIHNDAMLKKEIELLESLSDMKDAADIMKIDRKTADTVHPLDRQFNGLNLSEMTPLEHESNEFQLLSKYLHGSRGHTHGYNYELLDIFRIERSGEKDRFDSSPYAKIESNRRLLWHGSRCTNFGGILSQGLRIAPPEAPVSGYMFGKGIYLADMSSKSAGYCNSYISNGHALLLLCEAELGDPMQELIHSSYTAGESAKKNGMHSTWGQGRHGPSEWLDAGGVHGSMKGIKMPDPSSIGETKIPDAGLWYNEYICYDVAQVRLRYLFRVKM
ncbi:poly polymerase catalytic domain-containing protein [Stachybotrys elegans]|uniref:Poly [ADP-ribose] polymerase n=1 Tax=Stachybotrys elegans TaxID=80388 RepID=A0A8K0SQZ8_9HYPO|nr:poly polymerase catalytic domain-containing protein [Stachybotrys elegans]